MITKFGMAIQKILEDYCDYLYKAFGTYSINLCEIEDSCRAAFIDEVLSIYLREHLFPDVDTADLRLEIRELIQGAELDYFEEWDLLDKYEGAVQQYCDSFCLPTFGEVSQREELLRKVLALDSNNDYYIRLHRALLYCFWEKVDDVTKHRIISEILVDYDFKIKVPEEKQHLRDERFRINHYIPDFTNVKVGDRWSGGRRKANFIRALKLTPMKAGTHSRDSQESSMRQSCNWIDDEDNRILTLTEIFPERLPRQIKRPRKYEEPIETILLYLLQKRDQPFTTTKAQFFRAIGAISKDYKDYPVYKYFGEEPLKGKVSYQELSVCHELFEDIAYARLGKILTPSLGYLISKGAIKCRETIVIAVQTDEGTKRIALDDVKEVLGLSPIQAEEMIEAANAAALSQIFVYDEATQKKVALTSLEEMRVHHKRAEFKQEYEAFIRENYGWAYTYEEMALSIPEGFLYQPITYTQYDDAKKELNKLLVDAITTTVNTKYENRLKRYNQETEAQIELLNSTPETKELYEAGLLDESSINNSKRPYVYPNEFMDCAKAFICREIEL